MSQKIRQVERDIASHQNELEKNSSRFVTFTHFEAVVEPVRRSLEIVQKDVKEILKVVKQ